MYFIKKGKFKNLIHTSFKYLIISLQSKLFLLYNSWKRDRLSPSQSLSIVMSYHHDSLYSPRSKVTAHVWVWRHPSPPLPRCFRCAVAPSSSHLCNLCKTPPRWGNAPRRLLPTTSYQGSRGWSGPPSRQSNDLHTHAKKTVPYCIKCEH